MSIFDNLAVEKKLLAISYLPRIELRHLEGPPLCAARLCVTFFGLLRALRVSVVFS